MTSYMYPYPPQPPVPETANVVRETLWLTHGTKSLTRKHAVTEAYLQRLAPGCWKRGELQRVRRMVNIDIICGPELDYVNRCLLQPDDPQFIDWQWRCTNTFNKHQTKRTDYIIKGFLACDDPVAYYFIHLFSTKPETDD